MRRPTMAQRSRWTRPALRGQRARRAHSCVREGGAAAHDGGPATVSKFRFFGSEKQEIRYNMAICIDQIRKTLALIPLLGIRICPPARQRKNKEIQPGDDQYEKFNNNYHHT
ncbi:S-adenosyl-L-methionine Mg-protoporphyrin IX methyltranserase (ISS) [Dorcoceras hygrometricum]|uniref:S-adenosyl-L-methionine Mg-protoporphyrin IX methyltranserase (ISS) n=1 Tax=Dorcoceras hygrometricum TaxID=472368 RepID=A0A2Z6ZSS8_9LAMI|nr:S-adenosyl-L-methionine Mg-protoporphyrin IX methyltranserase (ISS) [Dorcoceras hygrometricum]